MDPFMVSAMSAFGWLALILLALAVVCLVSAGRSQDAGRSERERLEERERMRLDRRGPHL